MDGDGHDDIVQLQASVERLRQQRAQVERIKWESKKKDACIGFLREEIAKLNEQMQEENARLQAQVEVLERKAAVQEEEMRARQHELTKAAESHRGVEATFREAAARAERRRVEEKDTYEKRIADLEQRLKVAQRDIEEAYRDYNSAESKVSKATAELAASRETFGERERSLLKQLENLQQQLNATSFSKGEAEEHSRAVASELENTRGRLDAAESELQGLRARVEALLRENSELESGSSYLRRQLARAEADGSTEITSLRNELADAHAQIKARDEILVKQETALTEAQRTADSAETDLQEWKKRCRELETELERSQQLLESSNASNASLTRRVAEAESSLKTSKHEVEGLREKLRVLRGEINRERSDREQWAKARSDLLHQVTEEESRMQEVIDSTPAGEYDASPSRVLHSLGRSPPRDVSGSSSRRRPGSKSPPRVVRTSASIPLAGPPVVPSRSAYTYADVDPAYKYPYDTGARRGSITRDGALEASPTVSSERGGGGTGASMPATGNDGVRKHRRKSPAVRASRSKGGKGRAVARRKGV